LFCEQLNCYFNLKETQILGSNEDRNKPQTFRVQQCSLYKKIFANVYELVSDQFPSNQWI